MWIKKTKEELKQEPKRKPRYIDSVLLASLVFVTLIFHFKTGFFRGGANDSLSWNELLYKVPYLILFSSVIFLIVFLYQFRSKKNLLDGETTYICDRCNNKKLDDGKYDCKCGGEFIDINLMKWVEDEDENEKNTSAESD